MGLNTFLPFLAHSSQDFTTHNLPVPLGQVLVFASPLVAGAVYGQELKPVSAG